MPITLQLVESTRTIQHKILKAFVYELNKRSNAVKIRTKLEVGTRALALSAIVNAPEYASLVHGRLHSHFGIPNAEVKVDMLLKQWAREFSVQVLPWRVVGPRITGGFIVQAIDAKFSTVIRMPQAYQATEQGELLPWLNWLLLKGDQIIIRGYYYAENSQFAKYSRTNTGIMLSEKSGIANSGWTRGLASGGWRVPPVYSGRLDNNWITRAILGKGRDVGIQPQIRQLFQQIVSDI